MRNVYTTYPKCKLDDVLMNPNSTKAVIRFQMKKKPNICHPYFLTKENEEWKLDFWSMAHTMIMNHKNIWHFNPKHTKTDVLMPYWFAFTDYTFNKNGFAWDMDNIKQGRWGIQVQNSRELPFMVRIYAGGKAYKQGLRQLDQFISINNENFKKNDEEGYKKVIKYFVDSNTGETLNITVLRGNQEVDLKLIAP
ncbi:MAG: Unknown protein [uncultured Campylobacterales bacterium]|uniref:PDZ domain-containing protein n=1 Tax=uncultured Campylobacterales bacterium TaxID=352960 RepID=A0A6S6S557_9BACT|nr:MAG: Unknown protein [uncultured Campylobacterales bacterium]